VTDCAAARWQHVDANSWFVKRKKGPFPRRAFRYEKASGNETEQNTKHVQVEEVDFNEIIIEGMPRIR
jgi:hypothetical protein